MIEVQLLGEETLDDVVGTVVIHGDLFEDHLPLGVDVAGAQRWVGEHVTEEVDADRCVALGETAVVGGVLLGGERVDVTAVTVDRARDVARAAPVGALEQEVLEEVARAAHRIALVSGSDGDPDAGGHRQRAEHAFGGHRQA